LSRLRIASLTDPGARRGNEDDLRHGGGPSGHYAILADGAGGHSRGEEASQRTVDCIAQALAGGDVEFTPEALTQLVRQAHSELVNNQGGGRPEHRMHTTVVVLWIDKASEQALWTHVGDSRLYRVRYGRGELLTQDDSVVQHMLRSGLITEEHARAHPQKNHLLAALGIDGEVEPHTVVRPVELVEGDAYLLCSDGWWDTFEPEDIASSLARSDTPQEWLEDMGSRIRARALPRQDNFSAIAVWVGDPTNATIARFEDTIPRGLGRR
jgi:serine/threonine protein phosphatase PrpC